MSVQPEADATRGAIDIDMLKQELAIGYRVLGMNDIGIGILAHLTVRTPGGKTFWTYRRGQSVEEVCVSDLREVDFDLNILEGDGPINPNLKIHSEVYAARPDVLCIAHHHGDNALALGSIGRNVVSCNRPAGRWDGEIDLIEDFESPALAQQGPSIAAALGGKKALLLKYHGVLVTGSCIADAVVATIELERTCGVQLKAMAAGPLDLMPQAEIDDAKQSLGSERYYRATWDYYCRALARCGLDRVMNAPAGR